MIKFWNFQKHMNTKILGWHQNCVSSSFMSRRHCFQRCKVEKGLTNQIIEPTIKHLEYIWKIKFDTIWRVTKSPENLLLVNGRWIISSDSVRYAVVCACISCPSKGNAMETRTVSVIFVSFVSATYSKKNSCNLRTPY